jgi:TonB family protein
MKSSSPPWWTAILAATVLAAATPRASAAEPPRTTTLNAVLAVEVDASGRAVSIEPADKPSRGLIKFLRPEIAQWEFEPGRIDGVAVATRTSVILSLEARKLDDDYSLRIVGATTGPRFDAATPPRYPENSLRLREVGEVLMRVEVSAEGRPKSVAIERSNAGERLEKAAMAAVKKWTFIPESVGGRPVPATVLAPVNFCIDRACNRLPASSGMDSTDLSPRLVGEPAVKILRRGHAG